MPIFTGFIGPSYKLRSSNADSQRCVNMYPEINELGTGKNQEIASLISTPGLVALQMHTHVADQFGNRGLPNAPARCLYLASNGRLFGVNGNLFWEFLRFADESGADTFAQLAFLNTTIGKCSMSDNGTE